MRSSFASILALAAGMALPAFATSDVVSRSTKHSPNARNRNARLRHGEYPSGYPGAKLARKAMKGTVGKARIR